MDDPVSTHSADLAHLADCAGELLHVCAAALDHRVDDAVDLDAIQHRIMTMHPCHLAMALYLLTSMHIELGATAEILRAEAPVVAATIMTWSPRTPGT
jgi:hypothetical protein